MDGSPQVVRFDATTLWHFDAAEWAPSTASKADEATLRGNVRFTPESGHGSARRECPLCAKRFDHFVAVASSVGGMAMPRFLAVLRLMTSLLAPAGSGAFFCSEH